MNGTTARLVVQQKVEIVGGRVNTLTYAYRYQLGQSAESWLFRWEYLRRRPRDDYPYPLAHFHVNATSEHRSDLEHMHFPTRRVPLELVLWSLIVQWGVKPLSRQWLDVLQESIAGFEQRQTVR